MDLCSKKCFPSLWIQITVNEEEKIAKEFFDSHKDSLKLFGSEIPNNLHRFIAEKFEAKSEATIKNLENEKTKKINNLKQKFYSGENSEGRKKKQRKFVKKLFGPEGRENLEIKVCLCILITLNHSKLPLQWIAY